MGASIPVGVGRSGGFVGASIPVGVGRSGGFVGASTPVGAGRSGGFVGASTPVGVGRSGGFVRASIPAGYGSKWGLREGFDTGRIWVEVGASWGFGAVEAGIPSRRTPRSPVPTQPLAKICERCGRHRPDPSVDNFPQTDSVGDSRRVGERPVFSHWSPRPASNRQPSPAGTGCCHRRVRQTGRYLDIGRPA